MRKQQKGSVTIVLALAVVCFLSFCLVLLEGVRLYCYRVKAAQAMDLAEFSVLSEYQYELFSHYGVLFLDLDYELGKEYTAVLEQRISKYLEKNIPEVESVELQTGNFCRASDGEGHPFFSQAVELMKVRSGVSFLEEFLDYAENAGEDSFDLGECLEENEAEAEEILEEAVDDGGMPLFDISLPKISFPSIKMLREAVLGSSEGLSQKKIDSEERLSKRIRNTGTGTKENRSMVEMQFFHSYLFEHFSFYESRKEDEWKESLEYQLEYIIFGQTEDLKNLEQMMWRIFLFRAGGNYLFYHQDPGKMAEAEAEASAIAGISGNAGLIKAVKEILLVSKAIDASVSETRDVFAGKKVPLYEQGVFAGIELGYEEYLYLLLNTTSSADKIYRCMDLVELEVQKKSGYENFRLDHCTDAFEVTWNYEFDGLFVQIPIINGMRYEETMMRKFDYEK